MTKRGMCTGPALPKGLSPKGTLPKSTKGTAPNRKERMLKYKTFAAAFSYPQNGFFTFFPALLPQKEGLISEYDQLFRAGRVWLYAAEYTAENEFQRANSLADIMGFYRAFGLEPDKERPDSLPSELEFMHYLIFKEMHAPDRGKSLVCRDAQKKFFKAHLYPGAKKIAEAIIQKAKINFYREVAKGLIEFLEAEEGILK